jgi:hypothetical protein
MGVLKPFSRSSAPVVPDALVSGCFSVHRGGEIVSSTLASSFPEKKALEIARAILATFRSAEENGLVFGDLHIRYSGLTVSARELRGGALIFLFPYRPHHARKVTQQVMNYRSIDDFILHLENHIECWKQFNYYVNLARDKRFTDEDENQFLELKSLITQGIEAILGAVEKGGPQKGEVMALFSAAPSLRFLSDLPDAIPGVETQWHRIYLSLQSLVGQLKVQQNRDTDKAGWSIFGKGK